MKKHSIVLYTTLLISFPFSSFASMAYNCERYKGVTGKVSSVFIGDDANTATYISFKFRTPKGLSSTISVKATLNDASGRGMYKLLLTAWENQSKFKITRCYADQLAGGEIINL